MQTVRQFVEQSYRLISSHNPTVPLHGDDLSLGIGILNRLLQSYASTGLLLTIAKTLSTSVTSGTTEVTCGSAGSGSTFEQGRLSNLDSAWLILEGVTYPLIMLPRAEFLSAWKYDPLSALPRFIIAFYETDVTRLRLYPSPSQGYELYIRGKFQVSELDSNDDMSSVPSYYIRYLQFALAKDMAMYKGRAEAWTPALENMYQAEKLNIISTSERNLSITGDRESMLQGAARVRAGI